MKNILQRLQDVKREIAYVQKDKQVDTYMVVTHDQVTAHTRNALNDAGVIVFPSEVSSSVVTTSMTTGRGIPYIRFEATYDVSFISVDDPNDKVVIRITSHALDHGDKAPGKAVSYATKYAILKVLQLETGEEEEGRIQAKVGITEEKIADWKAEIGSCKTSDTLKELWKTIAAECEKFQDKDSYAVLKAEVTSKTTKLKEEKNGAAH